MQLETVSSIAEIDGVVSEMQEDEEVCTDAVVSRQFFGSIITDFLRAQVVSARNLPYWPLGSDMPTLGQVYVELSLRENKLTVDGPTVSTLDDAIETHRHLVITGDAGAGKSTLVSQAVAQLSSRLLEKGVGDLQWFPIYVPARFMVGPYGLLGLVVAALNQCLSGYLVATIKEDDIFFDSPAGVHGWLIFIDGIDEIVSIDDRRQLLAQLGHHADNPRFRFVITSRDSDKLQLKPVLQPGVGEYEISSFTDAQLGTFALAWFGALGAPETLSMAQSFLRYARDLSIADTIRVPLFATIAATTFTTNESRPPMTIPELYDEFVTYLLYRRQTRVRSLAHMKKMFQVAGDDGERFAEQIYEGRRYLCEYIAHQAVTGDKRPFASLAREWVKKEAIKVPNALRFDWDTFIECVLIDTGLIVRRGEILSFIHATICYFLAASRAELPGPIEKVNEWSVLLVRFGRAQYLLFSIVAWARVNDSGQLARQLLADKSLSSCATIALLVRYGLVLESDLVDEYSNLLVGGYSDLELSHNAAQFFDLELEMVRLLCSVATHHPRFALRLLETADADVRPRILILVLIELWNCGYFDFVLQRLDMLSVVHESDRRLDAAEVYIGIEKHVEALDILRRFLTSYKETPTFFRSVKLVRRMRRQPEVARVLNELHGCVNDSDLGMYITLMILYHNNGDRDIARDVARHIIACGTSNDHVLRAQWYLGKEVVFWSGGFSGLAIYRGRQGMAGFIGDVVPIL